MNILFLTSRNPFPPIGGDKLRVFKFLEFLSKEHSITLFLFTDRKFKDSDIDSYSKYFSRIEVIYLPSYISYLNCLAGLFGELPLQVYYYRSGKMKRLIDKEIGKFDLVFVHLIRMAEYVKKYNNIAKILDLTDAISLNYERSIKYQKGLSYLKNKIEKKRVLKYETMVINYFDKSLMVSETDKNYLNKYAKMDSVEVVPNGVNIEYFSFNGNKFDSGNIVFVGNMRTNPNNDAVKYFCNSIFDLVLEKYPDVKFYIVGANPTREVLALGKRRNIIVTGEVEDVRDYIRKAVVSVCPMRTGSGIQNKILEAMALGTPVITSTIGHEGIDAVPGDEILVCDDRYEFAEKIIRLIEDSDLRNKIVFNGRKLIEEKYSDKIIAKKVKRILGEIKN